MPYRFARNAALIVAFLLASASLYAQSWALPAKTQNTEVVCAICPYGEGKLTAGYSSPIKTFVGRFLDSQNTRDYQATFRTARADDVKLNHAKNRIYMRIGSALFAYDMAGFYTRLANGDSMPSTQISVTPRNSRATTPENFLRPDEFFYAEYGGGWVTPVIDGQDRLASFDFDDRGYIYLAYSVFGWGIVRDGFATSGSASKMTSIIQKPAEKINPKIIAAVKSDGRYYAIVGEDGAKKAEVWDVTNAAVPVAKPDLPFGFFRYFADSSDGSAVATLPSLGGVRIYSPDTLVTGGTPQATFDPPPGTRFGSVTVDGNDFWATSAGTSSAVTLHRFRRSLTRGWVEDRFTTGVVYAVYPAISFDGGYLSVGGSEASGNWNVRLYKVSDSGIKELSLGNFVSRYYGVAPSANYIVPNYINIFWPVVHRFNNKSYLIIPAHGIGDVYEIQGSDAVDVTVRRAGDQANIHSKQPAGSGPYFGDRVTFNAASSGAAMNLSWNFGNAESTDNTATSLTGEDVAHQFSGISTLPATRQVKATNASDAAVFGGVEVVLAKPTPRVALKSSNNVFTQGGAISFPIVTSDEFVDASDGAVEGHFSTWNLDSVQTKDLPNAPIAAGSCGAHSLQLGTQYGPYTGTGAALSSTGSPYQLSLGAITYVARPYAVSVTYAPQGSNVVFSGVTRASSIAADLPAGGTTQVNYQWDLVSGATVVAQGPAGTAALSQIPTWSVSKTTLGTQTLFARLLVTAAPSAVSASCANYASMEAQAGPLTGPDPVITKVGCDSALAPCSFTVASQSGASQANWSYDWTSSPNIGTSSLATPTFNVPSAGSYTVTLTATNPVGSKTVTSTFTAAVAQCASTPTDSNLSFNTSCNADPCTAGSTVTFTVVTAWGYKPADCDDYTWTFGGAGTTGKEKQRNPSVVFPSQGTFSVKLVIKNTFTGATGTVTQPVTISGGVVVEPPPKPTGCPTMHAGNVFISFNNPGSACNQNGGTCPAGDTLTFSASGFGYNFGCGSHSFSWNFGDGTTKSGQDVTKMYSTANTYPVKLTISNNSQTFIASATVTVGGTTQPPPTPGCGTMTANNVFATYTAPSGCSQAVVGSCNPDEPITFDVSTFGYSLACSTHTYTWKFPDNTTLAGKTVTKVLGPGTHTVQLEVKNSGQTLTLAQPVVVSSAATPAPDLNFSIAVFDPPYAYKFTPTTSIENSVTRWVWTFSDGGSTTETGTTPKPVYHTFTGPGTYTVTLTGSDASRPFSPVTKEVKIDDVPRGGRPVRRW